MPHKLRKCCGNSDGNRVQVSVNEEMPLFAVMPLEEALSKAPQARAFPEKTTKSYTSFGEACCSNVVSEPVAPPGLLPGVAGQYWEQGVPPGLSKTTTSPPTTRNANPGMAGVAGYFSLDSGQ